MSGTARVGRGALVLVLTAFLAAPAPAGARGRDPLMSRQWGLLKIQAPQAWRYSRGRGVLIGIVGGGIESTHEDLRGKVVELPGANFGCRGCPLPYHETAVAGIAAAWEGNGKGIAGVAPDAKILDVKIAYADEVSPNEGQHLNARAIRFAADHGARVINMSWAYIPGVQQRPAGLDASQEVTAALDYAWGKGAVLVGAAGNEALPLCEPPADHPRVLCVGAVDPQDAKIWYSNFGAGIDLVAPSGPWPDVACVPPANWLEGYDPRQGNPFDGPGPYECAHQWPCDLEVTENIWTTTTRGPENPNSCEQVRGYRLFGGTSAAAPVVSGVAALLASKGLTNSQIVQRIEATADDLGAPGWDPVYGWGRVNALRAVRGILNPAALLPIPAG